MSMVRAFDVTHVRFRAPDLSTMRAFLNDFGLVTAHESATKLYMRCHGKQAFVHATELGAPGFAGFAFQLATYADLERLAAGTGSPIVALDDPGGGHAVRLTDPDGYSVEAVFGQTLHDPIAVPATLPWNQGGALHRIGDLRRIASGPSHILRLGHVVLAVSDFRRSEAWYKERFGLLTSDEIQPAPGVAIGAFMRCDRGEIPCDHHTLFLLQMPGPPHYMHAAFEVADIDDLMAGHAHLQARSASAAWGVGRHILGSQVFDYWRDPWGHEVEHWTDGDQLRAADGGGIASIPELMGVQWGMEMPPHPDAPPREGAPS